MTTVRIAHAEPRPGKLENGGFLILSNIFSKLGLPPSDSDHHCVLAVLAYLGT